MRVWLLGVLALSGCGATIDPFITPDGKQGYVASCGGGMSDITQCYAEARKKCGGDYEIINRNVTPRYTDYGATENRQIEFTCKS